MGSQAYGDIQTADQATVTWRSGGRSIPEVIERLKIAKRMAAAPTPVPGDPTQAVEVGSMICRELINLGASEQVVKHVVGQGWRH